MSITTREWRIGLFWIILLLGVLVMLASGVIWFITLGHVRLPWKISKVLSELEDKIVYD